MANPEPSRNHSPGHEITPWRARPFLIGALSFLLFMGIVFVVVDALTMSWSHHAWPPRGPVVGPEPDPAWNKTSPQLQIDAPRDLQSVREAEERHLQALRWTDASHTYAAIPIAEAMNLLADAQARHQPNTVLPAPKPATPVELQDQKSTEAAPLTP